MVFAQKPIKKLSEDEVLIFNQSYMDIFIHYSPKKNHWKKYKMNAEESMVLKVKKNKQAILKLSTPGILPSTVLLLLQGGKKYDIYWYQSKKRLDITEFKENYN